MSLHLHNSRIRLPQGLMFWREVGQGPVLLFLHGSDHDGSQWLPVIEHLSATYHCFALDLLGFGESEAPKTHYSIELEVECLRAFLEAINSQEIYLIGHSLGGWVATSYALKHLDQVKGLILFSPEGVHTKQEEARWHRAKGLVGRFPLRYWLLKLIYPLARFLGGRGKIKDSFAYRKKLLQSPTACELLYRRRRTEIVAEFLNERLAWLKIPTLIIQGKDESVANMTRNQTYASLSPEASLRILAAGDDDLLWSQSQQVAEEIKQFITPSF